MKEIHGSYNELLFDKRWKEFRTRILIRDEFKCRICGSTEKLVVHHKQYHVNYEGKKYVPWDYEEKYLVTLCDSCHKSGHAKFQVPIFEIEKNK